MPWKRIHFTLKELLAWKYKQNKNPETFSDIQSKYSDTLVNTPGEPAAYPGTPG